jgi:hypothetical protein
MKAAGVSQSAIDRVLRLSKGRDPEESAQRLADYEETLALRKKPAPRRRKNVAQGNQMPTGFMPVLRNGLVSSALSLGARGVRALAPAFRTLADFGRRGVTLTKDMLNTPAGAQVAGAITAVAVSIFGRKVVESGKLTRQEAAVVQDVIMAQSGVSVSPAVISAAVKETT